MAARVRAPPDAPPGVAFLPPRPARRRSAAAMRAGPPAPASDDEGGKHLGGWQPNGKQPELLRLFPWAFTAACCFLFAVPAWAELSLARDEALSYFRSDRTDVVMIIPVLICATHYIHLRQRVPNKLAVMVTLIVPSLILFLCASGSRIAALDKYDKLLSANCDALPEKQALQDSWEAAYSLYADCLEQTTKASNYSVAQLMDRFRITDCEEYSTAYAGRSHQKEWTYLKYLEGNLFCSGWCYPGQQLWSSGVHKDSCSAVVSQLYRSHVAPRGSQVGSFMLVVLGSAIVAVTALGPVLRNHGVEW